MPDYNTFFQLRVNEICIASCAITVCKTQRNAQLAHCLSPQCTLQLQTSFTAKVSRSLCEVHIIKYVFQTGIHFSKS